MASQLDFVPNYSDGPCIYCKKTADYRPDELLECMKCHGACHIACIKTRFPQKRLIGDNFFSFQCIQCNPQGREIIKRPKISILDALLLTLYNLTLLRPKDAKNGFFHYKRHIYRFMKEYYEDLFPHDRKSEECLFSPNIICGLLAKKNNFFISKKFSQREISERGRWFGLESIAPPTVIIHRSKMQKRELSAFEPSGRNSKALKTENSNSGHSPIEDVSSNECIDGLLESVLFDCDDQNLLSSMESVPTDIFDCVEDINVDIENPCEEEELPYMRQTSELVPQNSTRIQSQLTSDSSYEPSSSSSGFAQGKEDEPSEIAVPKRQKLHQMEGKEEFQYPPCKVKSYFTHSEPLKPPTPEKKIVLKEGEIIVPMTVYDERVKLNKLNAKHAKKSLSQMEYLLRRKLIVRQTKREYGLPVFNVDEEVAFMDKHGRMMTHEERLAATYSNENAQWAGGPPSVLDRYQVSGQALLDLKTRRGVTFRQRLIGTGDDDFDFIDSPYTGRTLKPFIWRNYEGTSPKLKLLKEILEKARKKNGDFPVTCSCPRPIDYRYVTPNHIPALNHLAKTYFWDGIDLSEILQYPDFTCVASYGKLVVGFGVIVPDTRPNEGYISFLFVHPEWRRSGIGRFILYHLIQTCYGKDITLHVSATNPAMLLYQRFGFKVEEFLPNFYEKYLPFEDPQCKHAMFLRLHR